MTVAVVTDSAASLPAEVAAAAGIVVVPMWLTVGSASFRDGELAWAELEGRLGDGFATSGPTPGEFADALRAADEGQGVVVLTIAAEMSGTYGAARVAREAVDNEVRLVDTRTAAGAQGLVALAAAATARAGATLDEVEAAARSAAGQVRLVATVPSLDHLARGGRVPGAAAWAGRWLDLHPLFEFRRGRVRPLRPARGAEAAQQRVLGAWSASARPGSVLHVAAMHAADEPAADRLLAAVSGQVTPACAFVGSFSPVMVAHTGPGLVGLAWRWEGGGTGGQAGGPAAAGWRLTARRNHHDESRMPPPVTKALNPVFAAT